MSLHRFFVNPEHIETDLQGQAVAAVIQDEEAEHAARVLRLMPGTQIVVCDGKGMEYKAELESVSARTCRAVITMQRLCPAEPRISVCLFQGLAKADKLDWIVQKCTELGITAFYPVMTAHSVVKLSHERVDGRIRRWERVAREATKQCGRAVPPTIQPVMALQEAVVQAHVQHLLVPWEGAKSPLLAYLESIKQSAMPHAEDHAYQIGVVIGPEGGLAEDEVQRLIALGGHSVTLGPRILRTETAAIATITAVLSVVGEFGGVRTMDEWR